MTLNRVLEVIFGFEALHETTLSFLKKFAERRSYSEIRDDCQAFNIHGLDVS